MTDSVSARQDTRTRIVEVAAALLREKGDSAVTTRGVAEGADVQPPTIYRLFGDKDGLLEAVAEHVMAAYVEAKAAVVESAAAGGVNPLDDLRAGWLTQIDFGVTNPHLFRILSDPTRLTRSGALEAGKRVLDARVHRIAETGRLRVSEQRAVGLIQAAGVGVVQTLLATPTGQRDSGLADAIYEAILRQILTGTKDLADSTIVATTVAFRAIAPQLAMLSTSERQLMIEWLDRAVDTH